MAHCCSSNAEKEASMMLTRFFTAKKTIRPHQLGQVLYQAMQTDVASRSALSLSALLDRLKFTEEDLIVGYQTEIIVSLMYQALCAVEHTYDLSVARAIVHGITEALFSHAKTMGATPDELAALVSLFACRSQEYAHAEQNKIVYDHAYWRGKLLFEKMTGGKKETHDPTTPIKVAICSAFLTASLCELNTVVQHYRIAA
jgi:hypothetical protein